MLSAYLYSKQHKCTIMYADEEIFLFWKRMILRCANYFLAHIFEVVYSNCILVYSI